MKKYILLIILILITACAPKHDPVIDKLANCLADKGVKLYGTYWCHNCQGQKDKFGASMNILVERDVYVECDPKCTADKDGNVPKMCKNAKADPELCLQKKIEYYPTWEFMDKSVEIGVHELWELSEKTGCELEYD